MTYIIVYDAVALIRVWILAAHQLCLSYKAEDAYQFKVNFDLISR